MKKLSYLTFVSVLSILLLLSCEKTEEPQNEDTPIEVDTTGRRLQKLIEIDEETFLYDPEGRLIRVSSGIDPEYDTEFTWEDQTLEGHFLHNDSRWTLHFKNGRVCRYLSDIGDDLKFEYDEQRRLQRIQGTTIMGDLTEEYTWKGDRLIALDILYRFSDEEDDFEAHAYTFEYEELTSPKAMSPLHFLYSFLTLDYLLYIHPELYGLKSPYVVKTIHDHSQLFSRVTNEQDSEGYQITATRRNTGSCSDFITSFKW